MHSLLIKLLLTAVLLLAGPAMAGEAFIAGTHYAVIDVPVATGLEETAPAQVEVVEVFSYMCIHCYSFDPLLQRWEEDKPEGAAFSRLPAVFSDDWALMARAFYTAVMAGLFNESAGVAEEAFSKAYNSFFVRSRVMQARSKSRAYGLNSVPTMIVNGKYRVDGRMAGSNQAMLDVVNFLVEREREAN